MRNKDKLKNRRGDNIYINDDMTKQQREIQGIIRKTAREEMNKGKTEFKIGTWNIQGSNQDADKLHLLREILKQYKIDFCAVQEMKRKEGVTIEIGDYILMTSGCEDAVFGVGIMIHKKWKAKIKKFEPVSSRISLTRVKGKYRNITLINVHAPTEGKDMEDDVGSDHFLVILKLKEEIQSKSMKKHKIGRYDTY
ncbi:endonuclease/exonuclease/phosphatase superfamily [Holotrichia oblita]|uniref:Endonuclease/exonuclease/phosphatase superfamily n=1 Tax=Holotrichia oblita TaxID=644536 RepID=A0ACB9SWB2_HOLOL|nr:endonuclease/exonuclease/phosphatase superfamily [Holotrichia oblita]